MQFATERKMFAIAAVMIMILKIEVLLKEIQEGIILKFII